MGVRNPVLLKKEEKESKLDMAVNVMNRKEDSFSWILKSELKSLSSAQGFAAVPA